MKQIKLTSGLFALVDDKDFDWLSEYTWAAKPNGKYLIAIRTGKGKPILMHRMILGLRDPKVFADHINGDTLDNRRCNLRPCTPRENSWNRTWKVNQVTGYTGVYKKRHGYEAAITHMGQRRSLGVFETAKEAAAAYAQEAKRLRGEFLHHSLETFT